MVAEEKDRPFLVKQIQQRKEGECLFFDSDQKFSDLQSVLNQPSLFSPARVVICLQCDQFSQEQWNEIFSYHDVIFYFFKNTIKKSLAERFDEKGAILFLTQEKPWERKNRFISDLMSLFRKKRITISQGTVQRFVETVPLDLLGYYQEREKLLSFASTKKKITDEDIDAIFSPIEEENGFKVTEEIVWQGKMEANFSVQSVQTLLQIIGAFRFQAHLGLKLLSNETVKMPPWQEKKYAEKAKRLREAYFIQILSVLLDAEMRVKQSNISPSFIYTMITMHIVTKFQNETESIALA